MNKIDVDSLKKEIRMAVEKSVDRILIDFSKDEICAFALYSDSDACTLAPSFNLKAHLDNLQAEDPDDKAYYKWSPAEWSHEFYGADLFLNISKNLEELSNLAGEDEEFERYREEFFESCIEIMKEFKSKLSGSIFVFAVTDFNDIAQECSWIKSINSLSDYIDFEEWRSTV